MKANRNGQLVASERLIIALDFPDGASAERMTVLLAPTGVAFKVGLELFVAEGSAFLERLKDAGAGRIFLDLKFHDIPNTVAGAVASAARAGVWMMNLHAFAGSEAMRRGAQAARAAADDAGVDPPLLIAVTVLTSIGAQTLREELGVPGPIETHVLRLARLARDAGLDGVVAPGPDAVAIRQACGPGFRIVTPGIRPAGSDVQDQARVNTPQQAIRAGADYLVVGRPVTQAPDPLAACHAILDQIAVASGTALQQPD